MILPCPACATRYLVDPADLGRGGRQVRCARCGHVWFQNATSETPERIDLTAPEPASPPPAGGPVQLPAVLDAHPDRTALIGWATFVLVFLLLLAGLYTFRHPITAAWPATARLYDALSLPVNARDLALREIDYERGREGGKPVLVIRGTIVNPTGQPRDVPPLRLSLRDAADRELRHWTVPPPTRHLAAGARARFTVRLSDPPPAAQDIEIAFVS
jgi:predicted Zn finger-like uncharacterized protein